MVKSLGTTNRNPIGLITTRTRIRNRFPVLLITPTTRHKSGHRRNHTGTSTKPIVQTAISSRTIDRPISPTLGPGLRRLRISLSTNTRRRINRETGAIGTIIHLNMSKIDLDLPWSPRDQTSRITNTRIIIHRIIRRAATVNGSSCQRTADIPSRGRDQSRSIR